MVKMLRMKISRIFSIQIKPVRLLGTAHQPLQLHPATNIHSLVSEQTVMQSIFRKSKSLTNSEVRQILAKNAVLPSLPRNLPPTSVLQTVSRHSRIPITSLLPTILRTLQSQLLTRTAMQSPSQKEPPTSPLHSLATTPTKQAWYSTLSPLSTPTNPNPMRRSMLRLSR